MEKQKEKKLWNSLIFSGLGALLLFVSGSLPIGIVGGMIAFYGATALFLLGIVEVMVAMKHDHLAEKFKENQRAIGWQLAIFFALIPTTILVWFMLAWPSDVVWNAVTGIYTFTGVEATAANLVRTFISLIVGIAVFFGIIWLWVNSHRSENF